MQDAVVHLSRDPALAGLIARVGPPRLQIDGERSLYEALVRAIAHQQVHGRAAEANLARLLALFPGVPFPRPEQVLATEESVLRACDSPCARSRPFTTSARARSTAPFPRGRPRKDYRTKRLSNG